MANLKEIRNRITSVQSTMQITSAMKMVSAAKLKKAQDAITAMRPYSEKLTELLQSVSATLEGDAGGQFTAQREVNKVLVVVVTSNRGLCGGFNNNIIKRVQVLASETKANVTVLPIGKKAKDAFKNSGLLDNTNALPNDLESIYGNLTFEEVAKIGDLLMEVFAAGKFDKVVLVYNQFVNAANQIVTEEQLLPITKTELKADESAAGDYLFEPSKEEIVLDIIPKTIRIQLFKGILDSFASEHGARMTAMHKATDNASEMQRSLKLVYNKARQAAITNEILEIVGGAEALNG
jgi:F-type H+-transporting ATPase subunit gamma